MGIINKNNKGETIIWEKKLYVYVYVPKRVDQKLWSYSSDHRPKHCWIALSFFFPSLYLPGCYLGVSVGIQCDLNCSILCLSSITLASTSRYPTYRNLSRIIGEMLFISLSGHAVSLGVFVHSFWFHSLGGICSSETIKFNLTARKLKHVLQTWGACGDCSKTTLISDLGSPRNIPVSQG